MASIGLHHISLLLVDKGFDPPFQIQLGSIFGCNGAHFKHIGHPLFGDKTYGGDKILKGTIFNKYKQFVENCFSILPRQALHAKTLGFEHPKSGEKLHFDSELPEDQLHS